jgi:glycosyltransferase involved in cell wall biosynthesis
MRGTIAAIETGHDIAHELSVERTSIPSYVLTRRAESAREAPAATRLLIISFDAVGPHMAGAGIRYLELARVLSEHAQVTIAAPSIGGEMPVGVEQVTYQPHVPDALAVPIAQADCVLCQPQWPIVSRWLRRSGAKVIFDLYDPETLETHELYARRASPLRRTMVTLSLDRLDDALRCGHSFICASEKQRDLWLGAMLARRLIGAAAYERDPSFRSIIDVVPFGVPAKPPDAGMNRLAGQRGIRASFDQIGRTDEVVLWNGGIWEWLDAPCAIRAAGILKDRRPAVKLVFMGTGSSVAGRRATDEARRLAEQLGLLDRVVYFNDTWVPYQERSDWLLQASCAVATHREHLETRFAFRTRLLDCFWARLPIVCSEGDDMAELVKREGLGEAVAPGDEHALATALEQVLEHGRDYYGERLATVAESFAWRRTASPLVRMLAEREGSMPLARDSWESTRSIPHVLRSVAYRLTHRLIFAVMEAGRRLRRRVPGQS